MNEAISEALMPMRIGAISLVSSCSDAAINLITDWMNSPNLMQRHGTLSHCAITSQSVSQSVKPARKLVNRTVIGHRVRSENCFCSWNRIALRMREDCACAEPLLKIELNFSECSTSSSAFLLVCQICEKLESFPDFKNLLNNEIFVGEHLQ